MPQLESFEEVAATILRDPSAVANSSPACWNLWGTYITLGIVPIDVELEGAALLALSR